MKVLIASGGTGGHMFPAVAMADLLQSIGHETYFITDQRGARYLKPEHKKLVRNLSALGRRYWWTIPLAVWQMLVFSIASLKSFLVLKPDRVVGFGGYVSYPVLWIAWLFRIPYFIHEQNSVMGIVNRRFTEYAEVSMTTFPSTKYANDNVVCTGLPVRNAIKAVRDIPYHVTDQAFHLLVLGGSQGAGVFSKIIPQAIRLLPKEIQSKLSIVQQCRGEDVIETQELYRSMNIQARLESFIDNIADEFRWSHLVITRAGASSIAELTVAGRPAILVPYPHAMDDHQTGNALYVSANQAGWLIRQPEFTPELVSAMLIDLITNRATLIRAAAAMKSLGQPTADEQMVQEVLKNI